MAPELTTTVRLVRCPKCRQLLPELPEFQVYKCGGCGATLLAKSRIKGMRSRSSSLNKTMAAQTIGLDHVSGDRESNSSSRNAALSDSGECPSDHNNERDQSKSLERNESSSDSDKLTFPNLGECVSDRNNEKNEDKYSEDKESCSSSHNVNVLQSKTMRMIRENLQKATNLAAKVLPRLLFLTWENAFRTKTRRRVQIHLLKAKNVAAQVIMQVFRTQDRRMFFRPKQ